MATIRQQCTYTGRVQGVGFRATAQHIARQHPITGWVRNEPDGSVVLQAQGDPADIDAFLDQLASTMHTNITSSSCTRIDPAQAEDTFRIGRYPPSC